MPPLAAFDFKPFAFEVSESPEEEPEESEKLGPVPPWMVPPLTNVYRLGGPIYLWVQLLSSFIDLDLQECSTDGIGVRPDWLDREISDVGLDGIIHYDDFKYCDDAYGGSWVYWGIHNGIGPGQPFCVEIYPPHYYRVGGECDEWDCEWTWDIVHVMARKPLSAARSWTRHFEGAQRGIERLGRAKERVRKKRDADPSALFLRGFSYFAPGQSSYDDMEMPRGVGVDLCSTHTSEGGLQLLSQVIASGRDDNGNKDKALDELIKQFQQTPLGRVRTKWDLVREYPIRPYVSERTIRTMRWR
jgi:hypothetical protein